MDPGLTTGSLLIGFGFFSAMQVLLLDTVVLLTHLLIPGYTDWRFLNSCIIFDITGKATDYI